MGNALYFAAGCESRLHGAGFMHPAARCGAVLRQPSPRSGFYSRTRADGYQDPATRPSPAVITRMQRARPRFNFSITTRMIAAAPASSSLKHACSSPQCTDERATAVPSIGPTLFDDGAALSFHQTFDRIADGAHVAAGTSVHVSGVTANTSGGMGHTIGWARLANILDRGCFAGEV